MEKFQLQSKFNPAGDQPKAIDGLVKSLKAGNAHQTLLGVTGSGKTFSVANVIAALNRPTLVIAHNKTLAAQLAAEYRSFFPKNAVEYFVSYYDYYQPEAYIPHSDTYIEKEADINDEIDRLRHAATQAILSRRDVIIVASVSCIYGLGSPEEYQSTTVMFEVGKPFDRIAITRRLVDMQFNRTQGELRRGTFSLKGETLEVMPTNEERLYRLTLENDRLVSIAAFHPVSRRSLGEHKTLMLFPAKQYVVAPDQLERAFKAIELELVDQLKVLRDKGKLLEAERLERRTNYDLELIREHGYCNGIENYSRHFDGRLPGQPPYSLIDFFLHSTHSTGSGQAGSGQADDFLTVIDESHQTLPQIRGMIEGDRARKRNLVDFGFRLPSAFDNRPLTFEEFNKKTHQKLYTSATPASYELSHSKPPEGVTAEQIIRPTGLVDPEIDVRPLTNQVDDLMEEIHVRVEREERILITTLTKKMAEDLTEYFKGVGVKVQYLHSDVQTLERVDILSDLRRGKYDVLVGVNLLREGLDLPEVSLVAIMDADKEGFLRSDTSLIQTIGRAARNSVGKVIMYADQVTGSMHRAIDETNRRREKQLAYNKIHGITPLTIVKDISSIVTDEMRTAQHVAKIDLKLNRDVNQLIAEKEREMKALSAALQFEQAAFVRDELNELKKMLH